MIKYKTGETPRLGDRVEFTDGGKGTVQWLEVVAHVKPDDHPYAAGYKVSWLSKLPERSIDEVISLLESNYGYGRHTNEDEVKALIAEIRKLRGY